MKAVTPLAAVLATLLLVASGSAAAQWMWKDESGHTVISDQPPPKNVPQSRIMKSPAVRDLATELSTSPVVPADDSGKPKEEKSGGPKSLEERDLDYKKRQKEAAEAAKKQADADAKAAAEKQRCDGLRSNLASLQSGVRIARTNPTTGEREYLDDNQRSKELQASQASLQSCK